MRVIQNKCIRYIFLNLECNCGGGTKYIMAQLVGSLEILDMG